MASISVTSPAYIVGGVATSVTITGTGTSWVSGTTPITVNQGVITGEVVVGATQVTLTLTLPPSDNSGDGNSTVTFTDQTTSATASLTWYWTPIIFPIFYPRDRKS